MSKAMPEATEYFLRHARRSLWVLLGLLLLLTAWLILQSVAPEGGLAHTIARALPIILPIICILSIAWTRAQASNGKRRFSMDDPDARAVMEDEQRQANLSKSFKAAFFAILFAQPLLAWFLWQRPFALILMGAFTVVLAATSLVVAFLVLDRD